MYNLWAFLYQTLAASGAAAFLLILKRIFRDKLSPRWQYLVWTALLARLVVPVGFLGRSGVLELSLPVDLLRLTVELRLDSAWSSPWRAGRPWGPIPWLSAGAPRSVTDWLFVAYLAGVILCAARLLLGWAKLRRAVGDAVPVAGERLAFLQAAAEKFSLNMPQNVVESRAARTPFLMGVLRPVLVLPMGWEPDEKVVLHELLHLKYRDVAAGWVTTFFRCLHWCNPFLWYVFDRIGNDREALCDQRVLERLEGEDRRDYGRALLSMAEDGALRVPGATTMANGARNIRRRIQSIARFKTFPQGMGLVSGCMAVVLSLFLGLGAPVQAGGELPGWASFLGDEGELAWAMTQRATTPAGALDAFSKAEYLRYQSPDRAFAYRAIVAPEEDLPRLWAERKDPPYSGSRELMEALETQYRTGPMFRGLVSDGDGGYWTQMYFFRDKELSRKEWDARQEGDPFPVEWRRQTLSLRPRADGSWTVTELSSAQGELTSDGFVIRVPERPIAYWTGEADGMQVELWPEANVQVQGAFINGGTPVMNLGLERFGDQISFTPDLDANFSSVTGTLSGRAVNPTGEKKSVRLYVSQSWDPDGVRGYTGSDGSWIDLELEPGQTLSIQSSGGGFQALNNVETGECVITEELTAVWIDGQGGEHEIPLTREVNLK